jgi:tricorn protease
MPKLTPACSTHFPDVSKTQIVFTYGNDLWVVDKTGGIAHRLSSPKGTETNAKFSPNGAQIAFTGNYEGTRDIFVIPSKGGVPERVTYHGHSDLMLDWHPDGDKILFASSRNSGRQRYKQLYEVSSKGSLPEKVEVSYGDLAAYSPDGKQIAFNFNSRINRNWKRYRGGAAPDIHIFDINSGKSWNITNNDATDEYPMWSEDNIFYLSDQGEAKRYNIWVFNTQTKEHKQITKFTDFDIHYPSIGPDEIVFEAGGKLYLLNLESKDYKEVEIEIINDQSTLIPKQINVGDNIEWFHISPKGNRIIVEARGDIFSLPAEKGITQNLTQTSGVAERYPVWSPNGKHVAYWSDASGEYQLQLHDMKSNTVKTVMNFEKGYRYPVYWSPDSKKIVFINQVSELLYYNVENDKLTKFDEGNGDNHYGLSSFTFSWSPDSKWITYSRSANQINSAIFIYDTEKNKVHQVTSDFYSNFDPVFDPEGKYLYCLTNRSMNPVYSDMDGTFVYPNSTQIALIPLTSEIKSPFEPENDEVSIEEEKKDDTKKDKKDKDKKGKSEEEDNDNNSTEIDFDGFESRMILLGESAGRYGDLRAVKGKILYMQYSNAGSSSFERQFKYYDIEEEESETIIEGINGFELSADGEKAVVSKGGKYGIIKIAASQKLEKTIDVSNMQMTVNPKEEWKQMFWDAWRFERDFFYDENMHGLDWKAIGDQYAALIEQSTTREDVNFVLGELIAELNASHTYVGGGDTEKASRKRIGYLGVDWELDKAYKIKKIIKGAVWDAEVQSPLDNPGVNVKEGTYVLAVNGTPIDITKEPYASFQGLAGKTVELTINDKPTNEGATKILVKTLKSETRLRHLAWIEHNRQIVDKATDGQIGYIYVRSTGIDGQNELMRQFAAQFHKKGLVIDERFNSGGQIPDRFVELLNRKPLAYWATRGKKDWQWPTRANFGPKVMLINGWSGSGGDAFPDYFRKAGLGKLVGMRTWGGLIGVSGAPSLIDGGGVTVPTFRMYDPDGKWFKEGHGVDPDIIVPENPAELAKGKDSQLEKAIEVVLNELKEYKEKPEHEPYETR